MNLERFKEACLLHSNRVEQDINKLEEIDFTDRIADAVTVKNIYLGLPTSITRAIKILVEGRVKMTTLETSAVEMLIKTIEEDTLSNHNFIVMNSITRRLHESSNRDDAKLCHIELDTYPAVRELDMILVNKGLRHFHSAVRLYLALIYSIGRSFRKG